LKSSLIKGYTPLLLTSSVGQHHNEGSKESFGVVTRSVTAVDVGDWLDVSEGMDLSESLCTLSHFDAAQWHLFLSKED
jgi:hypothetical protein